MPLWPKHDPDEDGGIDDTVIKKNHDDEEEPYPGPYNNGERPLRGKWPVPGRSPRREPPPMQCLNESVESAESGWTISA